MNGDLLYRFLGEDEERAWRESVEGIDGEGLAAIVASHPGEKIAVRQRAWLIRHLIRKHHLSYGEVARILGITTKIVSDDLRERMTATLAGPPKTPKEVRAAPRLTNTQRGRRQAAVAKLFEEGWSFDQIAVALDIAPSTASGDAKELGITRYGRRKLTRTGLPDPIDWKSEPLAVVADAPNTYAATYQSSTVLADVQHWIEGFDGGDYPNALAWQIHYAVQQGDEEWLKRARATIERAHAQFQQLAFVVNDGEYRERCMRGVDREVRTSTKLRSIS